jgi:hypothetical protein
VSHATLALPDGLLRRGAPSDLASVRIARAYEPYVPIMGDAVVETREGVPLPPGTVEPERLAPGFLESPQVVVQPKLDTYELVRVIAGTSTSQIGAGEWLGVGERYRDVVLDIAFGSQHEVAEADQNSMAREALRDVGAIAGSLQADTITTARQRQEAQDAAVGSAAFLVTTAATRAPAPGTTGNAITVGTELVPAFLPDHLGAARDEVIRSDAELRNRFAAPFHDAAVEFNVGLGMPEAVAREEREELEPDRQDGCGTFGMTYEQMSDLGRRLGESTCRAS